MAFKYYREYRQYPLIPYYDLSYHLWQKFNLTKEANSGNPIAQHELGLRYLFGDGFDADTLTAFIWIQKAASHKLEQANYNLALFYINGWGVTWNPHLAFNHFMIAAKEGMPQAQFAVALHYTDDLVVNRNWQNAFEWMKKSADNDFLHAVELLPEIEKRFISDTTMQRQQISKKESGTTSSSNVNLIFLDFTSDDYTSDTLQPVLIDQNLEVDLNELQLIVGIIEPDTINKDLTVISILQKAVEAGSPEGNLLLARSYETGSLINQNYLKAALHYIKAIRLDSPPARILLWHLIQKDNFITSLQSNVKNENADALFVIAGLSALGYFPIINQEEIILYLTKAALQNHEPSLIELGVSYYLGNMVAENREKGISFWKKAESMGNKEAEIRIIMAYLFDGFEHHTNENIPLTLKQNADEGGILSQTLLAYCYENGFGVNRDKAEAAKLYRTAAIRGNRTAYYSLKRMHNEVKPAGIEE